MPQTPISNTVPLASPQALTGAYDVRVLGDLLLDNNTRDPVSAILTDPNVAQALIAATGLIESACNKSDRYQPTDLAAIVAQNGGVAGSAAFLVALCCHLAFGLLWSRRHPMDALPAMTSWAYLQLEELSQGKTLLSTNEALSADLASIQYDAVPAQRNGVVQQTSAFFGRRGYRNVPYGQNGGGWGPNNWGGCGW